MINVDQMLDGYSYATIIRQACEELHHKFGVVPVVGYVQQRNGWRNVLCHPEDQHKTDLSTFKHPYRDI